MIGFDEHPKDVIDRERVSRTILAKYGKVIPEPAGVIRPIEQFCRHCAQRSPLNGSNMCADCIDMKIRREAEQNFPGWKAVAIFALVAGLLLIALSGWMNPSEIQRTDNNFNASKGR
jgi:hypothetical protein